MSEPVVSMPKEVRPEFRPWAMGCLSAIAAKIGWDATLKAVEAGLAYHAANPLPKRVKPAPQPDAPAPVPAPSGPRIVKIGTKGSLMAVNTAGCEEWPTKKSKGKTVQGRLYIATPSDPGGEMVDYLTLKQMKGEGKTMANSYGHGEHSLNVKRGDPIKVWVESIDRNKRTQPVDWKWPFEDA